MFRFRNLLGVALALLALPAAAQTVTVTSPRPVNPDGTPSQVSKTFIVNADGTIATVASSSGGTVAQESTTAGQSGPLVQCAVVAGDQSFTAGKTDPLTCTSTGRLKVALSSATNIVPAALPATTISSSLMGCLYRTPVVWSVGYSGALQCDLNGNLLVAGTVTVTDGSGVANSLTVDCAGAACATAANQTAMLASVGAVAATAPTSGTLVMGSDGTLARAILTNTGGAPMIVPQSATGLPIQGAFAKGAVQNPNPLAMGVYDGANFRTAKGDTSGNIIVVGSVATNSAYPGSPLAMAGRANNSQPSTVTNGTVMPLWLDSSGATMTRLTNASGATIPVDANGLGVQGAALNDAVYPAAGLLPNGCLASNAAPSAVSADGDIVRLTCSRNGILSVQIVGPAGNVSTTIANYGASDGTASPTTLVNYGLNSVYDGSLWRNQRGDAAGSVTQPYALTAQRWQYVAPAGGLTNTTTAVTVKAAAGASTINYITGIQCTFSALGAATEFGLRDGAGGSFLWRMYVGTAGGTFTFVGPIPLKGTANTLVELVTLTASVTGAGYCNVQGYTAA